MSRIYRFYRNQTLIPFLGVKWYVLPIIERFIIFEKILIFKTKRINVTIIRNTPRSNGRKKGYSHVSIRPKYLASNSLFKRVVLLISLYFELNFYRIDYRLKLEEKI